jgi:hypothetical protein
MVSASQFADGAQRGGSQPAETAPVSSVNAGPNSATCAALGQPGAAAFSRVAALPILACVRCGDDFAGMREQCARCIAITGSIAQATRAQQRQRATIEKEVYG